MSTGIKRVTIVAVACMASTSVS